MKVTQSGSFRLFRVVGIEVFLHASWFVVVVAINHRRDSYSSLVWKVATIIGFAGAAGLIIGAVFQGSVWMGVHGP